MSEFVFLNELVSITNNLNRDNPDKFFPEWFPDHRTLICCNIELEDLR